MAGSFNNLTPSGYLNMLTFQFANEIQRMPIVNNNNTQAIIISDTPRVNVRSLIGCLFVLLNTFIGTDEGFIFYNGSIIPITIPVTIM